VSHRGLSCTNLQPCSLSYSATDNRPKNRGQTYLNRNLQNLLFPSPRSFSAAELCKYSAFFAMYPTGTRVCHRGLSKTRMQPCFPSFSVTDNHLHRRGQTYLNLTCKICIFSSPRSFSPAKLCKYAAFFAMLPTDIRVFHRGLSNTRMQPCYPSFSVTDNQLHRRGQTHLNRNLQYLLFP
jgi:hypothetical protein